MISEKSAFWGEGKQYLARLDLDAEVQTSGGTEKTRIGGELIVRLHGDHATAVGIAAPRFAIAGRSVKSKSGATGVFSVIGERGEGAVHVTKEGLSLKLDIQSKLNTESLDRARAKNLDKGCYHEPVFEPAVAHVTARVAEEDGVLTLQGFDLRVVCAAGDAEEILLIRAKAASLPLQPMLPSPGSLADRNRRKAAHFDNNNDCDPSLQVNRRRLIVQPVGFRASTTDTNPSGSTATAQLAEAQTVWAKACIDLDIRPIQILESATLKTSGDPTAIRASYTDSDPNVIEVYFVQNSLPGIGGGSAGAIGVASCWATSSVSSTQASPARTRIATPSWFRPGALPTPATTASPTSCAPTSPIRCSRRRPTCVACRTTPRITTSAISLSTWAPSLRIPCRPV